jgi:adenosylmethionine-8-amino-7-oxononanoate aminotransferase
MSFHFWHNNGQPKKNNFVSLQNGYHGETLGALSVTDVALFRNIYAPLLRNSGRVPTPDWRYAEEGELPKDYALRAANYLEKYLAENHTVTAAFVIEPLVQGAAGMGMYHPDYLKYASEICNKYQVHLIADEIAVGFGRTGTMFACEQANITPDFLCLAKGLSGGYLPFSVVMTTESIYQAFYHEETTRGFLHSHTHAGNALACCVALATLDIFKQDKIIDTNHTKIKYLNEISKPIASHPKVKNFRNCGMIWAFEVETTDPSFSGNFFQYSLSQELLLRPLGNTVYFMPPYIINNEEMNFLVTGILQVLDSY